RLAGSRNRVEFPRELPGRGVERADPAAVVPEPVAAGEALQHLAVNDDRSRIRGVALRAIGNRRAPDLFPGAGVERHEMRVGRRPYPSDPQILARVARDRPELTGAPALLGAPRHEPAARIGVAEHLVRDRHVVLHFTGHGEAGWSVHSRDAALTRRSPRRGSRDPRRRLARGRWRAALSARSTAAGIRLAAG